MQKNQIFNIQSSADFNESAIEIFHYQYLKNRIYRQFVDYHLEDIDKVDHFSQIPFLPIEFFKTHRVLSENCEPEITFRSSGTTGNNSHHYVASLQIYEQGFKRCFELFYGNPEQLVILALLPSYLEQKGSSLVYMVQKLIEESNNIESGFYLHNYNDLVGKLKKLKSQKVILFGVTYALLDIVEKFELDFPELIVVETGGMKGMRKEMIREDLHNTLRKGFKVRAIHSEYGMTELLSQAYSKGNGLFETPPWMKVLISDTNDPKTILQPGKTGGISIIDLANVHSCSFISTHDLGRQHPDGSFEVLGRFDNSDIRGCNLMIE